MEIKSKLSLDNVSKTWSKSTKILVSLYVDYILYIKNV